MEDLRGIIRDAIEAAKESGLWQNLSLKEKESVVKWMRALSPWSCHGVSERI